jgi:two-component system osmolarity sensor histidine kinase EnvZ
MAVVEIAARQREDWVLIKVRDHGIGVSPGGVGQPDQALLPRRRGPHRGHRRRPGLSIVDKTVQRMGGSFALANSSSGGLAAHIKLQAAK